MLIQSSKIISFFVIISFFLHPLMLNPLFAQEESNEYAQTHSESETDEEFDGEEFDDWMSRVVGDVVELAKKATPILDKCVGEYK